MVRRAPATRPTSARLTAAVVLAGCIVVLSVAAWVQPLAPGIGSHRQLNFVPCTMPVLFGIPCPTCGMTTALAHAVRGQFISAFHAQPAGLVLALATTLTALASAGVLLTARVWTVNWYRISPTHVGAVLAFILLAGWVYKLLTVLTDKPGSILG